MWTPPPNWPDAVALAHLGGVPELFTFLVPAVVFVIVRRIQFGRERRRQDRESVAEAEH